MRLRAAKMLTVQLSHWATVARVRMVIQHRTLRVRRGLDEGSSTAGTRRATAALVSRLATE